MSDEVPTENDQAIEALSWLLKSEGCNGDRRSPLSNLTFWCGAGYSKSWDSRYPTGDELFKLSDPADKSLLEDSFRSLLGANFDEIDATSLKEVVYRLEMYLRYPSIRTRYVDEAGIQIGLNLIRQAVSSKLRRIMGTDFPVFDEKTQKFNIFSMPRGAAPQIEIINFIDNLIDLGHGGAFGAEGLRPNWITTNYDPLIEAQIDCCLGSDDSSFLYLYRGITPEEICGFKNISPFHDHWLAFQMLKLNGGFEVQATNRRSYRFEYREKVGLPPGDIMLPSKEQNYRKHYYEEVFSKSARLLRDSKILIIVGYSLPEEDSTLRFLLRQFAETAEDGLGKTVVYVDMADREDMFDKLRSLYPNGGVTTNRSRPYLLTYSGSFGDFSGEVNTALNQA